MNDNRGQKPGLKPINDDGSSSRMSDAMVNNTSLHTSTTVRNDHEAAGVAGIVSNDRTADLLDQEEEVETTPGKGKHSRRAKNPIHYFPVLPVSVIVVATPSNVVNHSYYDFSKVPPEEGWQFQQDLSQMSFAEKVHHILTDENANSANITWRPHGRAFIVLRPTQLEKDVLPKYFGHGRFSGFLTQLKRYGFKQFTAGEDRGSFYHQCMLRGRPHLCKYMPTFPVRRTMLPDPDNEPDFYVLNRSFPLEETPSVASVSK